MNFFTRFQQLNLSGECTFKIIKAGYKFQVLVILSNPDNVDKASNHIPPLLLCGSAQDLDEGIFQAITEPIQKADSLLLNMVAYTKSIEKANEESASAKALKSAEADRKKQWDTIHAKIKEHISKADYDQAYSLLPTPDQFPSCNEVITALKRELDFKRNELSLFPTN